MDPSSYPDATLGELGEQLRKLETAIFETRAKLSELGAMSSKLADFQENLAALKAEMRRRLA